MASRPRRPRIAPPHPPARSHADDRAAAARSTGRIDAGLHRRHGLRRTARRRVPARPDVRARRPALVGPDEPRCCRCWRRRPRAASSSRSSTRSTCSMSNRRRRPASISTRLLWIRGHVVSNPGMCRDLNQRALEQAIRALTLVLQAGNFGLVVFDAARSAGRRAAPAAVHDLAAAAADGRRQPDGVRAGRRRADGAQLGGADAAN